MEEREFLFEDEENIDIDNIDVQGEESSLSLFDQEIDPSLIESFVPDKDSLDAFLKSISKIPLLTREEEIELAKRAKAGDKEALKKLVESNLRFVVSVAKKYLGCGLPLHDLIAEGILGEYMPLSQAMNGAATCCMWEKIESERHNDEN